MSQVEQVLNDWLNTTFNETYIMYSTAFEGGFRIVDHSEPSVNHLFYVLLCHLFPALHTGICPFSRSNESLTLFPDGVQVTIKPYDDDIHHTKYVKEQNHEQHN